MSRVKILNLSLSSSQPKNASLFRVSWKSVPRKRCSDAEDPGAMVWARRWKGRHGVSVSPVSWENGAITELAVCRWPA